MKVIGLTGGIGSGKSTAAQFLAELGAVVLELDKVGHEVLVPGSETWQRVVDEFGRGILTANDEIDRTKLGKKVFSDSEALTRLNSIIHPAIDAMVEARLEEYQRQGAKVVVLEAAAMLEAGRASQADEIWVTTAPESTVLKRLAEGKGYSEEEAKARIRSQMSDEERTSQADVVIDTDCSLEELRERVVEEWVKLKARL